MPATLVWTQQRGISLFVDGDDWVSPYYIENLYRALEQAGADFSASCFEEVFEDQPVQSVPTERLEAFEILSREECLRRILYQEGMEVTTPPSSTSMHCLRACATRWASSMRISRSPTR